MDVYAGNIFYLIKATDNCQQIARVHSITLAQLRSWNPGVSHHGIPLKLLSRLRPGFPPPRNQLDCDDQESLSGYYVCISILPASAPDVPQQLLPPPAQAPPPSAFSSGICFDTNQAPSGPDTAALGTPRPDCPLSVENRLYTVPGTNLTFLRSCETENAGEDLGYFPVLTMKDCLALCAQLNLYPSSAEGQCVGVTWAYGDGPQGTGVNFCFPKTAIIATAKRTGTESAELWTGSG